MGKVFRGGHHTFRPIFKPLTTDYLAKNIGKVVDIYARQYEDVWPRKNDKNLGHHQFIPSGDAKYVDRKEIYPNWLKSKTREIKRRRLFHLLGKIRYSLKDEFEDSRLGVSLNTKLVSENFSNTECFY